MTGFMWALPHRISGVLIIGAALLIVACSLKAGKGPAAAVQSAAAGSPRAGVEPKAVERGVVEPGVVERGVVERGVVERGETERSASGSPEIADLSRIPQELDGLAAAAGDRLTIAEPCLGWLRGEFLNRFFAPWNAPGAGADWAEARDFMKQVGRAAWYGPNKRKVGSKQMRELMANCALESFPSRNDPAISVAPGHLRGLPTRIPHYQSAEGYPFDMFSYPQVKLNEPLRVLHASRDGVWLFVETGYTNGWLEARDVALVDRAFVDSWVEAPHLVVVWDNAPVPDGRGVGVFPAKVGTILPLVPSGEGWWEVAVASAGEGGRAQSRTVRISREAAAQFPLAFTRENIVLIGNQFLGEPYGWGEVYGLRDCSAMLRDFFLPFGIWLPRTSADQIDSLPNRVELARRTPQQKEEEIRRDAVPFLTLLYKFGHIMLYVGEDRDGDPLVFHDAWSIRLQEPDGTANGAAGGAPGSAASAKGSGGHGATTQIIGISAITTLEPGKELGLFPGGSLLDRVTELGTITKRCPQPARTDAPAKK